MKPVERDRKLAIEYYGALRRSCNSPQEKLKDLIEN